MEEVEILCDRVIILDKGKIIAEGTTDQIKKLSKVEEKISVEVEDLPEDLLHDISNMKNILDVKYGEGVLFVSFSKGKNNLVDIIDFLKNKKVNYNSIFSERPTLNDVFLELTGKELRD